MEDKTFLQSDVIKMIEIIRDLIGGSPESMYWLGSTAVEARGIGTQSLSRVAADFCTEESDVDIVVVNPYMTSSALTVALEALALLKGLNITVVPGDGNGEYSGLPIARRFILRGLSRDLDLILCDRVDNTRKSMYNYLKSIDSALVEVMRVPINFGDVWKYPTALSATEMRKLVERDLRDRDRIRGTVAFGDRQLKMLSRLTNLKNLLQNY